MQTFMAITISAAIVVGVIVKARAERCNQLNGFGYAVKNGQVYRHGIALGSITGSQAIVTDGSSRHTLTRVANVAGAFTKRTGASLVVAFPGGTVHVTKLDGAARIGAAQSWASRYNALATEANTTQAAAEPSAGD